jgi:tetratricopeptide (TPR) repeat protein
MLGTALGRVGRKEEARTHLEYFTEAGDQLDRAARLVPEVARRPRDADLRYRIGKVYLDYGLPRDGLTWLASALECDPGHKPTHLALADYYQDKIGEAPTYAALAEQHRRLAGE